MEIKRFDLVEFEVIQCGKNGGYYPKGENAERAIVLMDEGIFQLNPVENWSKTGWSFTEYGNDYYKEFMKMVQEKHSHIWMTNFETNPDLYDENDEYGKNINIFAYSSGYHNGMKCKKCGYEFCEHCKSEFEIEKCPEK